MPPAPPVEVPGISHNQQGAEGESDPVRELSQKNKTVVTGMLRRVNNVKGVEDVQRYALRLYEEGGMTVDDYNELSQLMEAKRVSLTAGDRPTP
jgi:nitrogenase subunit NifH